MRTRFAPIVFLAMLIAAPGAAQLGLPPVGPSVGPAVGGVLDRAGRTLDPIQQTVDQAGRSAARLANTRLSRLGELVRRNRDVLELDAAGDPARRGELL
jgi:hypothetical protein